MRRNPGPGKLIALEGLDGAGTTTQARLLAKYLRQYRGVRVHVTREPSQGPGGAQIRSVLSRRLKMDGRTLAALFAADRIDHLYHQQGVVQRLATGEWVLMDRYYLSSFAYQTLALTKRQDRQWLWHLHAPCLVPDMTFFVDVPTAICLERIALNRGFHFELFEKADTLQAVRVQYLDTIRRFRKVGHNIQVVDGLQSAPAVTKIIRDRLAVFWDTRRLPPDEYGLLWRRWPVLERLRRRIETEFQADGLSLLTVNRLPEGQGYQLVFAGRPEKHYHLMAYLGWQVGVRLHVQGPEDDILQRLRQLLGGPSLWRKDEKPAPTVTSKS
jgi:dTMP kinase